MNNYRLLGKHEDCKFNGKVMECEYKNEHWLWCSGRRWEKEHREDTLENIRSAKGRWLFCGASGKSGDEVKIVQNKDTSN